MNSEERWQAERARLIAALGWLAAPGCDGGRSGLIEQITPLGAGGLPGTDAAERLVIGVATWPFPPGAPTLATLQELGYMPLTEQPDAELWLFEHADDGTQLLVAESGSTSWTDACLLRAFAAANEAARVSLAVAGPYPHAAGALLAAASAWWPAAVGFAPLHAVAQEMAGCPCPWAISSGWALDLCLGRTTRVHRDVDLIVDRGDQFALRAHLEGRGYGLVTPLDGRLEPWPPHMRLELPRHQVHAHRENDFIDILLTDFSGSCWHYRRDPTIVRALARAFRTGEDGLRYLAPELVLLFKSKNTGDRARPQDQRDFELVLPHLDGEARAWLHWALVATDPQHAWLVSLAAGA
jgi:hypothetical protein